jgi:hypothetical protein
MNEPKEYNVLEGEFRQNLLRGYCRLRQTLAQGIELEEAERTIELLGEPHLLTMQHPRHRWKLQIPLVFVSSWDLKKDDRVKNVSLNTLPAELLTLYKRRHRVCEPDHKVIHEKLVAALRDYIQGCDIRGGLLLDMLWAPRPDEPDYDEIVSENWSGLHNLEVAPDWLFRNVKNEELPNQVWKTNSLMRLTFPLYPGRRNYPFKMMTLIFGLAFSSSNGRWSDEDRRRMMRWVRRLAKVAMDDILHLSEVVEKRKGRERIHLAPPEWLRNNERDALHLAVDDLHRKIIEFAQQVGATDWGKPENGFNFLIAFKELDENFKACLRYRLSVPNLNALGAHAQSVEAWQGEFETKLEESREDLQQLFFRTYQDEPEKRFREYMRSCQEAIRKLFQGVDSLDEVKRRMAEFIEGTPYSMRLTPGYYVMNLSHPEIIKAWLRDPRAKKFADYPGDLLAWEATALPSQIYYSQVADGTLSIGICGANAELLDECPSYYELQEIIDESGPRFRYIICEEEFQKLEEELKEDLKMLKGRPRLWVSALRRFRRLGYYHFMNPWDYHTKLVYDEQIKSFDNRPWVKHRGLNWQELAGLTRSDIPVLMHSDHIPIKEGWRAENPKPDELAVSSDRDFYETDFLKAYLENYLREDWADTRPNLKGAKLHRVKMKDAGDPELGDTSLLVLIPDPQSNEFAKELIGRFVSQCEIAFEDYERAVKWNETYRQPPSSVPPPKSYDVFLCYNSEDRDAVIAIAEQLKKRDITPWVDWEIKAGEPWIEVLEKHIDKIQSAAILIGENGIGPWQKNEIYTILDSLGSRNRPIIPVLLLNAKRPDELPRFLRRYQWVDFNDSKHDPIERLRRGIKGEPSSNGG